MLDNFDLILDKCLDRIAAGEDLNIILSDYPDYAARLKPLLHTAVQTSRVGRFTVDPTAKSAAQQRFKAALAAQREQQRVQQSWFHRYLRPVAFAAVATIAVAALVVFISVQTAFSPDNDYVVSGITPVASPDGNFAFLISDEVNAISQFDNVSVGIGKIGIQQSDDKWIEIIPTEKIVDLTTVPGDAVKIIWQGDLPVDNYQQVFIYVDNVSGVLKGQSGITEIKLPGQKLHMAIPFTTSETAVTSFTYDLTVFATGSGKNSKYILKPQVGESGVDEASAPAPSIKKKQDTSQSINSQAGSNHEPAGEAGPADPDNSNNGNNSQDKNKQNNNDQSNNGQDNNDKNNNSQNNNSQDNNDKNNNSQNHNGQDNNDKKNNHQDNNDKNNNSQNNNSQNNNDKKNNDKNNKQNNDKPGNNKDSSEEGEED